MGVSKYTDFYNYYNGMKVIVFFGVQSPSAFKFTGKEDVSATHSVMLNEFRNQEVGNTKS